MVTFLKCYKMKYGLAVNFVLTSCFILIHQLYLEIKNIFIVRISFLLLVTLDCQKYRPWVLNEIKIKSVAKELYFSKKFKGHILN